MRFLPQSYNNRLLAIIVVVAFVLVVRLAEAAIENNNWRGFIYSFLHIAVVGAGTYFAIRKRKA